MADEARPMDEHGFFGRIGVLADDGERAQCHLCGYYFGNLGGHVSQVHGVAPRAYKSRFGLMAKTALLGPALKETRRRQALARRETQAFARFQEAGRRAQRAIPAEIRGAWSRGRPVSEELRLDPAMRATRRTNLAKANAVLRRRIAEGTHRPSGWNRAGAIEASKRAHARLTELREDPTWRERFARRVSEARGGRLSVNCEVCGTTFLEPHSHRRRRTCGPTCLTELRRRMEAERRAAVADDRARRIEAGRAIRARRLARGLSIERLAKLAGVSVSHLSRIEHGLNVPSDRALARFDAVLTATDDAETSPRRDTPGQPAVKRAA